MRINKQKIQELTNNLDILGERGEAKETEIKELEQEIESMVSEYREARLDLKGIDMEFREAWKALQTEIGQRKQYYNKYEEKGFHTFYDE